MVEMNERPIGRYWAFRRSVLLERMLLSCTCRAKAASEPGAAARQRVHDPALAVALTGGALILSRNPPGADWAFTIMPGPL